MIESIKFQLYVDKENTLFHQPAIKKCAWKFKIIIKATYHVLPFDYAPIYLCKGSYLRQSMQF